MWTLWTHLFESKMKFLIFWVTSWWPSVFNGNYESERSNAWGGVPQRSRPGSLLFHLYMLLNKNSFFYLNYLLYSSVSSCDHQVTEVHWTNQWLNVIKYPIILLKTMVRIKSFLFLCLLFLLLICALFSYEPLTWLRIEILILHTSDVDISYIIFKRWW